MKMMEVFFILNYIILLVNLRIFRRPPFMGFIFNSLTAAGGHFRIFKFIIIYHTWRIIYKEKKIRLFGFWTPPPPIFCFFVVRLG